MATSRSGWQAVAGETPGPAPDPAETAHRFRRRSAKSALGSARDFAGRGIANRPGRAQITVKALGGVLDDRASRLGRFTRGE